MADSQPPSATSAPPPPPPPPPPAPAQQYWCYHCDKRVAVETIAGQPDVVCSECKFGFVESIAPSPPPSHHHLPPEDATLGSQFLQVLRLLAQVAREDDVPPPPPPPQAANPTEERDFFRIEIDGWNNAAAEEEDDQDRDDDEEEEEDVRSVEIEGQSDEDNDDEDDDDDVEESEEDARRRRRDMLRLRLRDFATRARSEGRNRILDWAEILMGLEDNSIEFRFEMPETTDRYIGNPGDYVDAAEYEALLQNLAEAEGRRGAPPASKSAVENLRKLEIKSEEESYVCAICKDGVNVGEVVKEMPCGHGYHGDCIVPWLAARNSCPVCRFELPTDDEDYEEEKRKRIGGSSGSSGGNGSSASASL